MPSALLALAAVHQTYAQNTLRVSLIFPTASAPIPFKFAPGSNQMYSSNCRDNTANPASTDIIGAIPAEHLMHLNDQVGCTTAIEFVAGAFEQLEKIANRKCVGPKVPLLSF
jgi:hypothetical protein